MRKRDPFTSFWTGEEKIQLPGVLQARFSPAPGGVVPARHPGPKIILFSVSTSDEDHRAQSEFSRPPGLRIGPLAGVRQLERREDT
jgi:hypothetical protein